MLAGFLQTPLLLRHFCSSRCGRQGANHAHLALFQCIRIPERLGAVGPCAREELLEWNGYVEYHFNCTPSVH